MDYLIQIGIGVTLVTTALVYIVFKTAKGLKSKKINSLRFCINALIVTLLVTSISITIVSTLYNFSYEKGVKSFGNNKYYESVKHLETALAIRSRVGNLSKFLEKSFFGFPLFFSTETDARMILASSYRQLKDYHNAIEQYLVIISIDEQNYDAMANTAECYFVTRNFTKAAEYYRQVVEIHPKEKNFDYYFSMGKAFMVLLNYKKAIVYYKKAIELGEQKGIVTRYIKKCEEELSQKRGDKGDG